MSGVAMRVLEHLAGRRGLWRLGRKIYLHTRRDGDGDPATNGEYDLHRAVTAYARKYNKPLTVVDIGGYTGYWTSHLLETCQTAGLKDVQVFIFEPSDESRAKLTKRMTVVPGGYRVKIRSEAVSDKPGTSEFDVTSTRVGTQRLLPAGLNVEADAVRARVTVTTLATVFEEEGIQTAEYVKSDVEGFDLSVMRGAHPLLEQGRIGVLQFEYNHCWVDTRSFLVQVFELVKGLPYSVCKIAPGGLERFAAWHPEMETFFDGNFALVRHDLLDVLGVAAGGFDKYNTFGADRNAVARTPDTGVRADFNSPVDAGTPMEHWQPRLFSARVARRLRGLRKLRGWERAVAALGTSPAASAPFVVRNKTGYFAGDLTSFIDRRVYLFGQYEEDLVELFISKIPANRRRTALDVGANVGTHSLAFSHYFEAVHSFDPNPKIWKNFEENVRLNGFQNITLHKLGLADRAGEIPFYNVESKNAGMGTCSPDEIYDLPLEQTGSVQVVTGDEFVKAQGIGPVDAIKMDVQGFELAVIRGLQDVLARDQPYVWLEVGGPTAKDIDSVKTLKGLFPFAAEVFRFEPYANGVFNAVRLTRMTEGPLQYADYLIAPIEVSGPGQNG